MAVLFVSPPQEPSTIWSQVAVSLGYSTFYYLDSTLPNIEELLRETLTKFPEADLIFAPNGYPTATQPILEEIHNPIYGSRKVFQIVEPPKYAWATLVMGGDAYVGAAAVLCRSLQEVKTKYPLYVMYTSDVSKEAQEFLQRVGARIILVDYITKETTRLPSEFQVAVYAKWINSSFTKWQILNPKLFPFDKVMFMDADMLVRSNVDFLFDLPTPAGTFSSPWNVPYDTGPESHPNYYYHDREPQTGDAIDLKDVKRSLEGSALSLYGSLILLHPDAKTYQHMFTILNRNPTYGRQGQSSGADEQMLADLFLELKMQPTMIHQSNNWVVGKTKWLPHGENPTIYHYHNAKPWTMARDAWPDLAEWWAIADSIMRDIPGSDKWFEIKSIGDVPKVIKTPRRQAPSSISRGPGLESKAPASGSKSQNWRVKPSTTVTSTQLASRLREIKGLSRSLVTKLTSAANMTQWAQVFSSAPDPEWNLVWDNLQKEIRSLQAAKRLGPNIVSQAYLHGLYLCGIPLSRIWRVIELNT